MNKHFIVNLKSVNYMDSTSIGTLMSMVREVQILDAEVKFVGVSPNLARILKLVNAASVFQVTGTLRGDFVFDRGTGRFDRLRFVGTDVSYGWTSPIGRNPGDHDPWLRVAAEWIAR